MLQDYSEPAQADPRGQALQVPGGRVRLLRAIPGGPPAAHEESWGGSPLPLQRLRLLHQDQIPACAVRSKSPPIDVCIHMTVFVKDETFLNNNQK